MKLISYALILLAIILISGCTTTSTISPATTTITSDVTTTSTATVETTWTSITYKNQMYEFMVEVYTGWDWEFVPGGVGFFADGNNWSTKILSSEIDSIPTLSELGMNENLLIDDFFDKLSEEEGYSDFNAEDHYITSSIPGEFTSSELHIDFTCTLDGTEMSGFLYSIYTGDRHYQIIRMFVLDRIYEEGYLHEASLFYWTFNPSYTP